MRKYCGRQLNNEGEASGPKRVLRPKSYLSRDPVEIGAEVVKVAHSARQIVKVLGVVVIERCGGRTRGTKGGAGGSS